MDEIRRELKTINKNQRKIMRRIEFLMNSGIMFSGLYTVRSKGSFLGKLLGLLTAVLALVCQIMNVFEDLKEVIDEPDDEESEVEE